MLRLSSIRIPVHIALAASLPMLAFTWLAATNALEKRAIVANMEHMADAIDRVPASAGLVHELQRERGTSAGFQSTAASHALAAEAQKLADLVSRFNVGEVADAAHKAKEPVLASAMATAKSTASQMTNGLRSLFQRGKPNGASMLAMATTRGANTQPALAGQG